MLGVLSGFAATTLARMAARIANGQQRRGELGGAIASDFAVSQDGKREGGVRVECRVEDDLPLPPMHTSNERRRA